LGPLAHREFEGEHMPQKVRSIEVQDADASIRRATLTGPEARLPGVLFGYEDYYNPRVERLRREYHIDKVVRGEANEFRRILRLRHWVATQWPIDDAQSFPYRDPFAILEKAKTGAGFHCAHTSLVMHCIFAAFGLASRVLYIDVNHRTRGRSGHHGITEVWSNDLTKWLAVDPKYDIHFERRGVPLSASELHVAVRKDGGKGVIKVKGLSRRRYARKDRRCRGNVGSYYWVSYLLRSDLFTHPEWAVNGATRLVVWNNEAWRKDTWMRNGDEGKLVKHHAYAQDAFICVKDRNEIDWSPGVPVVKLKQERPGVLAARFVSATPNFKAYLVRQDGGPWRSRSEGEYAWRVKSGRNTLAVRTRNLFGLEGPVVSVALVSR
jgi:hypothetical protein